MPPRAFNIENIGVGFPGAHSLLEIGHVLLRFGFVQAFKEGADTLEVAIPEGVAAADDKAAVPADDVAVDQGAFILHGIQGENFLDILHRQSPQQSRAGFSTVHIIGGGNPQYHHPASARRGGHRDTVPILIEGFQKGFRVAQLEGGAEKRLNLSILGVEGQIGALAS